MERLLLDDVKLHVADGDEEVFTHYGNIDCAQGYDNHRVYAQFPNNGFCKDSESSDDADSTDLLPRHRTASQSSDTDAVKPLMYPRRRAKTNSHAIKKKLCKPLLWPLVYFVVLVGSLVAFALITVRIVNGFSEKLLLSPLKKEQRVVGCSNVEVEDVWISGFPKLMTESSFRLLDVNNDGDLDIIFGFATGAEGYNVPDIVCDIYFHGNKPCLGGLIAVDGRTGQEIWRHYSPHEVFAVSCEDDLSGDSKPDCIIAGRVGTFEAVDMSTGKTLWNFTHSSERVDIMNLYTGQFISDINSDGTPDILNIHGGDPFGEPGSKTRLSGKLIIFSGRDGSVLQTVEVPDGRESYYSPVVYTLSDGTQAVLFGTGGETHPGSLWFISLHDVVKGNIQKAQKIYSNSFKGVMTPPVLLDLTGDGVMDIVMATYNSSVIAFDGDSFVQLWNFTYPSSETYATPAPGYFNDDDVPDFMVHWQYGPGFPVYYHAVTSVIDGRNGKSLLSPYIKSSVGAQTSPLTVSMEGLGNDLFIYWLADCLGHEGQGGKYDFVKGTNVHEKSRSDVCRLRFKSEGFSRQHALSNNMKAPGAILYDSEKRQEVEHSAWINSSAEAQEFLLSHPDYQENYNEWREWVKSNKEKAADALNHHSMSDAEGNEKSHDDMGRTQAHSYNTQHTSYNDYNDINDADGALKDTLDKKGFYPELYRHVSDILADYYDPKNLNRNLPDINSQTIPRRGWVQSPYEPSSRKGYQGRLGQRQRASSDHLGRSYNRDWLKSNAGRRRRHVGPHDGGGLQRLISTGTLAPSLLPRSDPGFNQSIDLVFATYWFYPAKTKVLLPQDEQCIKRKMALQNVRFNPSSKYFGMDDDGYEHAITEECLEQSKHQLMEKGIYTSQNTYNPYSLNMGQLTLYRLRLKCTCTNLKPSEKCSRVLPFKEQQWPSYMGRHADSKWIPRGFSKKQ